VPVRHHPQRLGKSVADTTAAVMATGVAISCRWWRPRRGRQTPAAVDGLPS